MTYVFLLSCVRLVPADVFVYLIFVFSCYQLIKRWLVKNIRCIANAPWEHVLRLEKERCQHPPAGVYTRFSRGVAFRKRGRTRMQ